MSTKSTFKKLFGISLLFLLAALFLRAYHHTRILPLQSDHEFAFKLYMAIVNATTSAKGTVHVRFRPVNQKTRAANFVQNAFWRVYPDTNAEITFDLQNNKWNALTVDFGDHPIMITLAVDTPLPGTIRVGKIVYGSDGRIKSLFEPGGHSAITEFIRTGQSHAESIGFYTEALSQLKIVPQAISLLTDQNLSTGPLRFDSVEIREHSQDTLRVKLVPGTDLPLGVINPHGCNFDSLSLTESDPLSFSALSYDASTKRLLSSIGAFSSKISNACLTSGQTVLKMGPSQIEISQLGFGQTTMNSSFLSLQASSINGQLTTGTNLILTQTGDRPTEINFTDSAKLESGGLKFEVRKDGVKVLSLASTNVDAGSANGVLAPDIYNRLFFKTPRIKISIVSAEWDSIASPKIKGEISPTQIEIASGNLVFNSANKLTINSGVAQTERFAIDTSQPGPISGALTPNSLVIGEGSVIGSANRFSLDVQGRLMEDPSNRITFSGEPQSLKGKLNLLISTTRGQINFGNNQSLNVNSGTFESLLAVSSGGSFAGQIKGRLLFDSGRIPIGQNASIGVSTGEVGFDQLTFSEASGLVGSLTTLKLNLSSSEARLSQAFHFIPSDNAAIELVPSTPSPEIANSGLKGLLRINAPLTSGEATMVAGGFFQLGQGAVEGTIVAAENAPTTGTIKLISKVSGGSVKFDPTSTLELTSDSKISADSLTLNQDGYLSGVISQAHFEIKPGSSLMATRGRRLTIAPNSRYETSNINPLNFSSGENSPIGEGQLIAKFSDLEYSDIPSVSLRDGEIRAQLSRLLAKPLEWEDLIITGKQIGSYSSLAEMPDDEYRVVARFSSGSIETISAANRVMIVNTVPIAINSNATFNADGRLSRAILAEDATVFGIPVAGGSPVEIDAGQAMVLAGTLGRDITIDGIKYSKGCLAHLPPTALDHQVPPCERITSLAFRIKTSSDAFSSAYAPLTNVSSVDDLLRETKDDIWIDIGPKAWRIPYDSKLSTNMTISGDFHGGETATIEIVNPSIGEGSVCSALDGPDVPLFVGDIRGIRLEKKGIFVPNICGVAEGADTDMDVVLDPLRPPDPRDLLKNLNAAIQLKRETLALKRLALKTAQDKLRDLQPEIDKAQAKINQFIENRAKLTEFQNSLIEKRRKVGELLCDQLSCPFSEVCPIPEVPFLGCTVPKIKLPLPCPLKDTCNDLNNVISDLEIKVNNIQSWLQIHAAEEGLAAAVFTLKASLEVQIRLVEGEIAVFNAVIDATQPVANELQNLIDHLIPGIDVPLPGQWKPESLTVIVNGRELASFSINERLRQGNSYWQTKIRPMSDAEYFVQGLRVNIVKGDGSDDYFSFIATPAAKMRGFSGWDSPVNEARTVTAVGVLQHPPSFGLDAGVSLDLKLEQIVVDGRPFILDDTKGIRHERFIRVEYRFGTDERFRNWHVGDKIWVTGEIKRDRDRTTFYEIHLHDASQIDRVSR
jgi:hypothetical protein